MKQSYQAPEAQMLSMTREDVLSMSHGDPSQSEAKEISLAFLFE